jgi:hypothetical protein
MISVLPPCQTTLSTGVPSGQSPSEPWDVKVTCHMPTIEAPPDSRHRHRPGCPARPGPGVQTRIRECCCACVVWIEFWRGTPSKRIEHRASCIRFSFDDRMQTGLAKPSEPCARKSETRASSTRHESVARSRYDSRPPCERSATVVPGQSVSFRQRHDCVTAISSTV